MSILTLLLFFTGAVLGMRFKVLVLVSAIGFASIIVFAAEIIRGESLRVTLVTVMLTLIALQIGYLGSILARYAVWSLRASLQSKASLHAESNQ